MGITDTFKKLMGQTQPDRDALDRPDLRRAVVDGILDLRQRGARGRDTLPSTVQVRVQVGEPSLAVVRAFIDDSSFDAQIEAELLNRLVGVSAAGLPLRLYAVQVGEPVGVTVTQAPVGAIARLVITGGDRDGTLELPATRREFRLGRGRWHGDDETLANDVIVCDSAAFVSRRAAVLRRAGSSLEVESIDQEDCLVVVRGDGRRVRPYHTGRQRVRVEPGDIIEFNDGADGVITVAVQRPDRAEEA